MENAGDGVLPATSAWTWGQNLYLDTDLSECGFQDSPVILSSMSGNDGHGETGGSSELYFVTNAGFRNIIWFGTSDLALANSREWSINWKARASGASVSADGACWGRTTRGNTAWALDGSGMLYVDVDMSACGFQDTPVILSSMGGRIKLWTTTGSSEIYSATNTGFRIYIFDGREAHSPSNANSYQWYINWRASSVASGTPTSANGVCSGRTTPGNTAWALDGSSRLHVDIDTSECGFQDTPVILSSIGGSEGHGESRGSSEIYSPTNTSFRIYIFHPSIDAPSGANSREWHINWVASISEVTQYHNSTTTTTTSTTGTTTSSMVRSIGNSASSASGMTRTSTTVTRTAQRQVLQAVQASEPTCLPAELLTAKGIASITRSTQWRLVGTIFLFVFTLSHTWACFLYQAIRQGCRPPFPNQEAVSFSYHHMSGGSAKQGGLWVQLEDVPRVALAPIKTLRLHLAKDSVLQRVPKDLGRTAEELQIIMQWGQAERSRRCIRTHCRCYIYVFVEMLRRSSALD